MFEYIGTDHNSYAILKLKASASVDDYRTLFYNVFARRCIARTSIWSFRFAGKKRMAGLFTFSAIASASKVSFLFYFI